MYRGILSGLPAGLPRNVCNTDVASARCYRGAVLSLSRGGNPNPMSSFRRLAFALALGIPAAHFAFAQAASSSSNPPAATPDGQAQSTADAQNQGALTVQARIRDRREKRRQQAIKEVYSHLYEVNIDMGYARFVPGPNLQRVTLYAWNTGVTRFYNQRLGVTVDGRGYYGTPYVGLNFSSITKPSISAYTVMGGPTYRFYMQPRFAVSARVLGGYAKSNFSSDTNGFGSKTLGLYPDTNTFAASAGLSGEYNLSPSIGLRLAPEYFFTGFGSTVQYSPGFTAGFVFRFGKQ